MAHANGDEYREQLKSFADMANIGGRPGEFLWGCFLARFAKNITGHISTLREPRNQGG